MATPTPPNIEALFLELKELVAARETRLLANYNRTTDRERKNKIKELLIQNMAEIEKKKAEIQRIMTPGHVLKLHEITTSIAPTPTSDEVPPPLAAGAAAAPIPQHPLQAGARSSAMHGEDTPAAKTDRPDCSYGVLPSSGGPVITVNIINGKASISVPSTEGLSTREKVSLAKDFVETALLTGAYKRDEKGEPVFNISSRDPEFRMAVIEQLNLLGYQCNSGDQARDEAYTNSQSALSVLADSQIGQAFTSSKIGQFIIGVGNEGNPVSHGQRVLASMKQKIATLVREHNGIPEGTPVKIARQKFVQGMLDRPTKEEITRKFQAESRPSIFSPSSFKYYAQKGAEVLTRDSANLTQLEAERKEQLQQDGRRRVEARAAGSLDLKPGDPMLKHIARYLVEGVANYNFSSSEAGQEAMAKARASALATGNLTHLSTIGDIKAREVAAEAKPAAGPES